MSEQLTSQSRLSRGISRRTALRGAAWSASAVTIVVATPNIAAASTVQLTGTVTSTEPTKDSDSNTKHVYWTITIINTSASTLTGITADFAFADNGGGAPTALKVKSSGGTWKVNNLTDLIAAFSGSIPPGGSLTLSADFVTPNNAAGAVSAAVYAGTDLLGTTGTRGF